MQRTGIADETQETTLPTLTARIETAGIEPGRVEVAWVKGRLG